MSVKKLALTALVSAICAGCTTQYVGYSPEDPQDVPVRRAFFPANPSALDAAFKEGCNSPGDRFSRPDRQTARCNILPSPESAAFLLTQFDAQLEVPNLVVQKITRPAEDGFEVEMSYFAEIRAKTGNRQRVYIRNPVLDRQIDVILENSGGRTVDE